ncbi:MAG: sporulation membrane protein YtaF [Clostridia bacterium]|nr:sporulation membrane protein YtaF [Clostridia bacterium]
MELFSLVIFAFALSLDGFGVGVAYGMRRIKIPIYSIAVVSITSAMVIGLSMAAGHLLSQIISVGIAQKTGAAILVLLGLWILIHTWLYPPNGEEIGKTTNNEKSHSGEEQVMKITIKPLGLVIQILRQPAKADFDRSGTISSKEALFLGVALAMDALGAGFGAAMAGYKPLLTPLVVGLAKFLLVSTGVYIGQNYAAAWLGSRAAMFPGWVLVILGVMQIINI